MIRRPLLSLAATTALAVISVTFPASAATLRQLYVFACNGSSCPNGKMPVALFRSADGNFYGATQLGGAANAGTVFRFTSDGQLTTFYSLMGGANGEWPTTLVEGADGALYGTTLAGGANENGVVFRVTKSGGFRLLHNFCNTCGEGADPEFLIAGKDGNFYGGSYGVLFRVSPKGAFKVLHTFDFNSEGPGALGLVQASNGNFYGTSVGAQSVLTVAFRMTPSGSFTTLQTFHYSVFPFSAPIQVSDGRIFGVLSADAPTGDTAGLFHSNLSGSKFVIGALDGSPTDVPRWLMQASDGTFWGTMFGGNRMPQGALINYSLRGKQLRALAFDGSNGKQPDAPLIELGDGTLMGVTADGGTTSNGDTPSGTIFAVN